MQPILSILICTIEGRENFYNDLKYNIARQMLQFGLKEGVDIEVLVSKDKKGERSIGWKRNLLLKSCRGKWFCFIDDDDKIADYLREAIDILNAQNPDCINLIGELTIDGRNNQKFIHELKHTEYFTKDNVHYRPPNHLNIIRSSIGRKFKFPEINNGEDTDWAMQICKSRLLKTEGRIEKTTYFYRYILNK